MNLFLIRYGEISVKGQNKSFFIKTLRERILKRIDEHDKAIIKQEAGRLYLESSLSIERMSNHLKKIPGIVSFSPAKKVPSEMDSFCREGLELLEKRLGDRPSTFRVKTRRTNKAFPATSMEISREVGAYILRATKNLSVDLNHPDHTLSIEVRREGSFLYTDSVTGVGGLPVGTSGGALLLLSGGIDSPVAGWMALKRGVQIEGLYFHSSPFVSERSKVKVIDLSRALKEYSSEMLLSIISLTPSLKMIRERVPEKYTITIMRRMMMRIAEKLAEQKDLPALITGESIGQVASQTLENIKATSAVVQLPILRPLSGMDKMEITRIARAIETYRISVRPYEDCCTLFIPKHPALRPKEELLKHAEKDLPIERLIEEAIESVEIIEV